ncbi:hypothetical protein PVK06_038537 [Gossypium arboreum]|uniref:Uncharacterized protein n=1 Tax=Gossypium arboreum TaxID=29729 RepID=A0ABR0N2Z9_GOSAR|nr:hypothetical protein PVK06_038537 [Gossypium arboreum]
MELTNVSMQLRHTLALLRNYLRLDVLKLLVKLGVMVVEVRGEQKGKESSEILVDEVKEGQQKNGSKIGLQGSKITTSIKFINNYKVVIGIIHFERQITTII